MNVYRAMITELVTELEKWQQADDEFSEGGTIRADANYDLVPRARAILDQHEPEVPTTAELMSLSAACNSPSIFGRAVLARYAFAIVQQRLAQLAGNEELMLYRWPFGDWHIHHTNPSSFVQLGEVTGEYNCTGSTLEEAACNLARLLPTPEATNG